MAVCLRPGTELAFEDDVQTDGVVFRKKVRDLMLVGLAAVVAAAIGFILVLREAWHRRITMRWNFQTA